MARKGGPNGDGIVEDPNLDEHTAQKLKEIEGLDTMQPTLKHITKKWTEQSKAYYVMKSKSAPFCGQS